MFVCSIHAIALLLLASRFAVHGAVSQESTLVESACSAREGGTCGNSKDKSDGFDEGCIDKDNKCLFWAQQGDCVRNPKFMSNTCPQSCEQCFGRKWMFPWESESCQDDNENCEFWASTGECFANPNYMKTSCRMSCIQCVDPQQLRSRGSSDEVIMQRFRYVEGEWGPDQRLGEDPKEKATMAKFVQSMFNYLLNEVTALPLSNRLSCKNYNPDCAIRAFNKQCETNVTSMMAECPLACQFCESRDLFDQCGLIDDESRKNPWIRPDDLHLKFEKLKASRHPEVIFQGKESDDPWILKWESFLSNKEMSSLTKLAKGLPWQDPAPVFSDRLQNTPSSKIRRHHKSAFCDGSCMSNAPFKKLQKSLSQLIGADVAFFEPFEFVHFSKIESLGVHHDVPWHQLALKPGPRVLSIFFCLSDVPGGGAMGFPDLDWLTVPPKQGQLLVWPNVLNSDPTKRSMMMMSESLPVTAGEKYGIYTYVRLYNYSEAANSGCIRNAK